MTTASPAYSAELDKRVAKFSHDGYTVVDRTPRQVILQRKKRMGWLKPLILLALAVTVIGLFFIPLVLGVLNRKMETVVLTLDDSGKVRVSKS
ncbi:MAG: hypothetical protein ACTHZX_08530 [Microbacterium sp.]